MEKWDKLNKEFDDALESMTTDDWNKIKNKMTKHKKVTWECLSCNKQHESYSNKRWEMQVCECGKSGLDLEEHYSRVMGEIKIIKEEEYG